MAHSLTQEHTLGVSPADSQRNIAMFCELFVAPAIRLLQPESAKNEAWMEFTFKRESGMRNVYMLLTSRSLEYIPSMLLTQSQALTPSYFNLGYRARDLGRYKRGGISEVVGIPALWLDIDLSLGVHAETKLPGSVEDVQMLLEEALPGRPPNLLVYSGGGLHAYWMFATPWFFTTEANRQQARLQLRALHARVQQAAARHGWRLDNVSDLARMLRVPGTYNAKDQANPKLVEIISCKF